MKNFLLIAGIVIAVACVLCLLYGALNYYGYRHVLDGSAELYDRLHRKAVICFAGGAVMGVISAVCFVIRSKM